MKRIRSACILQTLVFSQRPELGLTKDQAQRANREEFERYKSQLDHSRTKYLIVDESEEENGSIVVRVKKQYNGTSDVSEYF